MQFKIRFPIEICNMENHREEDTAVGFFIEANDWTDAKAKVAATLASLFIQLETVKKDKNESK